MTWNIDQFLQSGALAILEAMGDAISIQDRDLRVLYQNHRHIKLMGDQKGRFCYEAYQKLDAVCPECHLVLAMQDGKTTRKVTSSSHSTRGLIFVEIISSPLKDADGNVVAGIETVRDITERKMMDERFRLLHADLEQKTWKLMASNSELESFSYTLSHDMRNFIARIAYAAHILSEQYGKALDETGQFLVKNIDDSCQEMDELIDAVLRLSTVGKGSLDRCEVDLGEIAVELAADLRIQYPDHEVELEITSPITASGDRQLLKILIGNLIGNAWKYTRNSSKPKISFFIEEHDGRGVFVVRDNGVGFDMKEAYMLFKPFSRLTGSQGFKGVGVGLATVRRIVQSHGGEIWGNGVPDKGATFYFTLPDQPE
jgi:PAS domain S-box-containing protein